MACGVRIRQPTPGRESRPSRPGFSLVELLVVIAIAVILLSIFVPYVSMLRETDRQARCAENLRAIGRALLAYADHNGHDYPRVRFDPQRTGYVAFTGADSVDPFAPASGVQGNDVTASLWLVVRGGLVEPYRFACPSTSDTPDPMYTAGRRVRPDERSNFTSPRHLSYSYCSPFATASRFRLNSDVLPPDFAVAGDKNPGTAGGGDVTGPAYDDPPIKLARANSANHDQAGQNVLYADGHVQFQRTPYCGVGHEGRRDNVYTAHSPVPPPPGADVVPEAKGVCDRNVGPAWEKDSYLVPTDDE